MKNLKKYSNLGIEILLKDYLGEEHRGIVKTEGRSGGEYHYFFVRREDGAKIKIFRSGKERVIQESPGVLKLKLLHFEGLTPDMYPQNIREAYNFEKRRIA